MSGPKSEALFQRAERVIPGGVSSPVRAFGSVGGHPFFVEAGEGAYLIDADGRRLIDYVQSWGASILGHAHPAIVQAVQRAAALGTSFGTPTRAEVSLAEAVTDRVSGAEMVRFVSSGTEAAMTALRLARGVTGRDRVVKFSGCYHGHADPLLAAGGSGVATLGLSGSAGVPSGSVMDTLVLDYNTLPEKDDRLAAVIVEPIAANMGLVEPVAGFLDELADFCRRNGSLLIFDEVITGFRLQGDGAAGRYGIDPDLYCFGKVLGGGLPLAAVAGKRCYLEQLAPVGPIYQAGTLSGNPLATAAGLAALEQLDDAAYAALEARAARLQTGMESAFATAGLQVQVPRVASLLGVFFSDTPVHNYAGAQQAASSGGYQALFNALLARGIYFAPSPYEVLFVSLAHGEAEIDTTLVALEAAAHEVAQLDGIS